MGGGKILFDKRDIEKRVKELGREISRRYAGEELIVVGVLKGAWIFMADLVRAMDMDVFCDFVRVSSYGSSTESSGEVCLLYWPDLDFKGKRVLVVDDIADTGLTSKFLKQKFLEEGAVSVEFCVLLDKPSRRQTDFKPDYTGFTIPDKFVVGYGMDFNESYRNLPHVEIYQD